MAETTLKKLKNNKCYCSRKSKDISLSLCESFQCNRWKKCMTKTNRDIDKDLKKRRDKYSKKIQEGQSKKEKTKTK